MRAGGDNPSDSKSRRIHEEGFTSAFDLPNPPIAEPELEGSKLTEDDQSPFGHIAAPVTSRIRHVWAVGGGKGGVGKSLIASSMAISLARAGNRVVAIDLDLGGANLHTALGVELPSKTLGDFTLGKVNSLSDCLTPTPVPYLEIISGAQDSVEIANLSFEGKVKLLEQIRLLDTDYVLLDLGAGSSINTLDFFLFADIGVVTILPEPTSIENAYRFIKACYYRKLRLSPRLQEVKHLIQVAMDPKNNEGIRTPSDLYREINKLSPEAGLQFKEEIARFQPKLVVNQARTQTDIDIGFSVKSVCKKYFGVEVDYSGYLDYDSAVWQAVRRKRPLMLEFPNSRLVSSIERIAQYLVKKHAHSRSPIY